MNFLEILERQDCITTGHIAFKNGLHTNGWIEKGGIVRFPQVLDMVAKAQAAQIADAFPTASLLVGAPACGAVLAGFVGRYLQLPVAFVQGENDSPSWHRMNIPTPPQEVVFVDDLICTGQGAASVIRFLIQQGHNVLGVSAWMSRVKMSVPLITLADMPFHTYTAVSCPMCDQQIRLTREGVRE